MYDQHAHQRISEVEARLEAVKSYLENIECVLPMEKRETAGHGLVLSVNLPPPPDTTPDPGLETIICLTAATFVVPAVNSSVSVEIESSPDTDVWMVIGQTVLVTDGTHSVQGTIDAIADSTHFTLTTDYVLDGSAGDTMAIGAEVIISTAMRDASLTDRGVVSTGAQSFNGVKTFDDYIILNLQSAGSIPGYVTQVSSAHHGGGTDETSSGFSRYSSETPDWIAYSLGYNVSDDFCSAQLRLRTPETGSRHTTLVLGGYGYDGINGADTLPRFAVSPNGGNNLTAVLEGSWGTLPDGSAVSGGLITNIGTGGGGTITAGSGGTTGLTLSTVGTTLTLGGTLNFQSGGIGKTNITVGAPGAGHDSTLGYAIGSEWVG